MSFLVWNVSRSGEAGAVNMVGFPDPGAAAVRWAELDHERNGSPDGFKHTLNVRCPNGVLVEVDVDATFDPCFYAKAVR